MAVLKTTLNINDAIIIDTPIGKIQVMVNHDGIDVDLSKPEAMISVEIRGTNVASQVRNHGNHSRGNNQQVQIINGKVNGGQISQSNGDSIQIQSNRYRY
jgi:hypothetical protein